MKKLIALVLLAVMVLSMAACGAINKTEVAVLWSGDGVVKVPNSLINAMERAMYIESISYKHYGANNDQAEQTKQAQAALDAGCPALVVELVDVAAAADMIALASAKNVPLIFVNCDVDAAVLGTYDKCALVTTDKASAGVVQGEMIGTSLTEKEKSFTEADIDGDGKISYLALGDVSASVAKIDEILKEADKPALVAVDAASVEELTVGTYVEKRTEYGQLTTASGAVVEMIIAADDVATLQTLVTLQEKGFNKDKLATHCIALYTVGAAADYKDYVLQGKPEGALADEAVQTYFEQMKNLVDLTSVEKQEDLDVMVYNTTNVIDAGRMTGAAVEDYDSVAVAVAEITANLLKGKPVEEMIKAIPYTTHN